MFPVLQSVRQGGITSPFLYLIYIDGLIKLLESSGYGLCITGADVSSLSVADDMILVSLSKYGLQKMMNICYEYSCKWRYLYNPSKCAVTVFNESRSVNANRSWFLGNSLITEVENYNHLGIICNKYMKISVNIDESCRKLKSTLLGLMNVGIHDNGLLPPTSMKIYKSVVLPRALYGCELWSSPATCHISQLEKAHRFCIKYIQNLPVYTRTDICLSMVGAYPIEFDIDYRKLLFLGQLCRLFTGHFCKQLFNYRLVTFYKYKSCTQQGFVSDIVDVLRKYDIEYYLTEYMSNTSFPTKSQWKSIIRRAIHTRSNEDWLTRVQLDRQLNSFLFIKPQLLYNSELWEMSRSSSSTLTSYQCNKCVRLIAKFYSDSFTKICSHCKVNFTASVCIHLIFDCQFTRYLRNIIFEILQSHCDRGLYNEFLSLESNEMLVGLFSGLRNIVNDNSLNHRILMHIVPVLSKFADFLWS